MHAQPALLRDLSIITSLHEPICPPTAAGHSSLFAPKLSSPVLNLLFALFLVLFFFSSHGGWSSQSDVSISTENSLSEVSTGTQGTRVSLPQSVQGGRNTEQQGGRNTEQLSISQVSGKQHQHGFNFPFELTTFLAGSSLVVELLRNSVLFLPTLTFHLINIDLTSHSVTF